MNEKKLILASGSPRRRELLALIQENFEVIPSHVDEKAMEEKIFKDRTNSFEEKVEMLVKQLSLGKARQVAGRFPGAMVIGADTVVVHEGKVLGKPENNAEAFEMIRSLAGQIHRVMTGVAVCWNGKENVFISQTKVCFLPWDEQMKREVESYVKDGHPMDKAGGYGIQETAGLWVDWIDGDYFNVVGLPVVKLNKVMEQMKKGK